MVKHGLLSVLLFFSLILHAQKVKQQNIIFILSDDHRYDAMAFMGNIKGLQTPAMDRMANERVHIKNAFVLQLCVA